MDRLEDFYETWSKKAAPLIDYDNETAVRKIDAIASGMPCLRDLKFKTMIDFGCGYGKALREFTERFGLERSYGFDFSETAIEYAKRAFGSDRVTFHRLQSLDIDENMGTMKEVAGKKVSAILLLDLLEHIPDCQRLIAKLSEMTDYFIIKLPIENNVLQNYFLGKQYPSSKHDNGHLREFNANSVFEFIRKLGLTPIAEGIHIYDFRDSYPPSKSTESIGQKIRRRLIKYLRMILALALKHRRLTKIYIRLFGPGSYYCVATFRFEHILTP